MSFGEKHQTGRSPVQYHSTIRDFPDHTTFREKSVATGLVGQAWGFPLFDSM